MSAAPRLPGLRVVRPGKAERRGRLASWLREWFSARGVKSGRGLAEIADLSRNAADEIWIGERPFPLEAVGVLPARYRAEFVLAFAAFLSSSS